MTAEELFQWMLRLEEKNATIAAFYYSALTTSLEIEEVKKSDSRDDD